MAAFDLEFPAVHLAVLEALGDGSPIRYQPDSGAPFDCAAVFEQGDEPRPSDLSFSYTREIRTRVHVRSQDVAQPVRGDTLVTASGQEYEVRDYEKPDAHSWTLYVREVV